MRQWIRAEGIGVVVMAVGLAACSANDRWADTQVRPTDRAECLVGSQRKDMRDVQPLIGGTGCRADPANPKNLYKPPE
ncbi:hypothetical protein [Stenotrophomonas sp. 24(2023)]|uniref:hypothetical protein n=1 Tax=Stenotrophomonas sp. 24(2023) TaxID=3068324 RepID=UPI0027DF6059|nr:hypothetical protein [Stenotrophomonas sp. 24(2023)]WMJ68384.1 hypothetical protein Q9R17_14435 [Stenotrophomonas sp. 24(2023)]